MQEEGHHIPMFTLLYVIREIEISQTINYLKTFYSKLLMLNGSVKSPHPGNLWRWTLNGHTTLWKSRTHVRKIGRSNPRKSHWKAACYERSLAYSCHPITAYTHKLMPAGLANEANTITTAVTYERTFANFQSMKYRAAKEQQQIYVLDCPDFSIPLHTFNGNTIYWKLRLQLQ